MKKPTIELLIDLQEVDLRLPEFRNKKQKFNTYTIVAQTTDTQLSELQAFGIQADEMITTALYNDVNLYIFKKITRQILYHCGKPRVYKTGLFSGPEKYLEFNNYMMNSGEYLSNYDWIILSPTSYLKLLDENPEFKMFDHSPKDVYNTGNLIDCVGKIKFNDKLLNIYTSPYYPVDHDTHKIDMIIGKHNWAEGEYFPLYTQEGSSHKLEIHTKEMFPSKRGYMRIIIEK